MANGQGRFGTRLRAIGLDALLALYGPAKDIGRLIVRFLRSFCPDRERTIYERTPLYMLPSLWYTSDMREKSHLQKVLEDVQEKVRELQALPGFPVTCCYRCGHWWMKRTDLPKKCPRCRSKHWPTERSNQQGRRSWEKRLAELEAEQTITTS